MSVASIPEVLEDLRRGRMVVLVDDEHRENEGDLVLSAEAVTPEALNFMLREARGFICLPLADAWAERLGLFPMVEKNQCPLGTPFTVTIDAREGITTGVSVQDRAVTIRRAVAEHARAEDFVRPGHVFPLRAHPQGLRGRHGHTEGSVALMDLGGLRPVAVIAEIMNADGSMARGPQLQEFARAHQLKIATVREILRQLESGARTPG